MSPNHDHNRRFGRGDQVERVKQIPNGRHVPWNVQIVVIITHARIWQIVAPAGAVVRLPGNGISFAASREREQCPVSLLIRTIEQIKMPG
jgi:hypothetical protein